MIILCMSINYIYIISTTLSTPQPPLRSPLRISCLLCFLLLNICKIHTHTHIHIPIYNGLTPFNGAPVYRCLRLPTWDQTTSQGHSPRRKPIIPLSVAIECLQFFILRQNFMKIPPSTLACRWVLSLGRYCLATKLWLYLRCSFSIMSRMHQFAAGILPLWLL